MEDAKLTPDLLNRKNGFSDVPNVPEALVPTARQEINCEIGTAKNDGVFKAKSFPNMSEIMDLLNKRNAGQIDGAAEGNEGL